MPSPSRFCRDSSALRFVTLALIFAAAGLLGGSSQPNMPSQLLYRPMMVIGLAALLMLPGPTDWRGLRFLLGAMMIFAGSIVIQLVPLPPEIWALLPGHDRYSGAPVDGSPWRPISLAPDLTVFSLFALLPATAVIIAFAGMNDEHRRKTLWLVLAGGATSILMATLQIAGGQESWAYLYSQGDRGVPSGLLANRNHQALLLASCVPIIAAVMHTHWAATKAVRTGLIGFSLLIVPLILITGSRSGMALGLASGALSIFLMPPLAPKQSARANFAIKLAVMAAPAILVAITLIAGRALSIDRAAAAASVAQDMRLRALPTILQMTQDFFPFGTGFGTFDSVYRGYEPDALLHPRYFNRAHNDALELAMTGGLMALLPLAMFLAWLAGKTVKTLRAWTRGDYLTKAGLLVIFLTLAASIPDYPLRTGFISAIFAIACCWVGTLEAKRYDNRPEKAHATLEAWKWRDYSRAIMVLAAAAPLSWVAFATTASYLQANGNPESAVRYWPTASAQAALAAKQIIDPTTLNSPVGVQAARALALNALRNSPVNAVAVRALAMSSLARGDLAAARREFTYGESVSRRDVATQIWMTEDSVVRDDIASALLHYDRAMLVSEPVRSTMVPVLASAADEPAVMKELVPILQRRPEWWPGFIDQFLLQAKNPDALVAAIRALKLDPGSDFDRPRIAASLSRLVEINTPNKAAMLYSQLGGRAPIASINDGSFEAVDGFGPFSWQLGQDASRERVEGAEGAFALMLSGNQATEAAQQVLLLPSGRYRLSAIVGNVDAAVQTPPFISISCTAPSTLLMTHNLPTGERDDFTLDFNVPNNCYAQRLVIYTPAGATMASSSPWIDAIKVRSVSSGPVTPSPQAQP